VLTCDADMRFGFGCSSAVVEITADEVEANSGLTRRILQAAECPRRSASKPAEHWAEQEAADRSAQGCHYGDNRNRHQSRNECVFDCRDARLVASKFLNRYEHFAAELTSPKLRSAVRHSGGGHIASEICGDLGGQSSTPQAAPPSVT